MKQMLMKIIEDISTFFCEYAGAGAKVAAVVVVVYWCALFVWKRCSAKAVLSGKQVVVKSFFLFLLVMYGYIVVGITILSRSESGTRYAYFELFRTFQNTFQAKKQIYENILLFMPYAVLLFGLGKCFRRGWLMFGIGVCSSLAIEVTQWGTHTGYFELDDIWTNVLGMMVAYIGCIVISGFVRRWNSKLDAKARG